MTGERKGRPWRRPRHDRVLGGVCAGLAARLGLDPLLVRTVVAATTLASGGLLAIPYAIAWGLLPAEDDRQRTQAPKPEEDPRGGRGAGAGRIALGVAFLTLGILLAFRELGLWWSDALVWPLVLALGGAALLWGLATGAAVPGEAGDEGPAAPDEGRRDPARPSRRTRRRLATLYGGFGVALVIGAGLLFLYWNGALAPASDLALATLVLLTGLGLVLAPFWLRVARSLSAERAERIRSQERAEVAAHLHDSVLQTLALVQKRAGDPREVAQLARRQERELRDWLSGDSAGRAADSLRGALEQAAVEVEEAHGTPIEAVFVGDGPLGERGEALVAAAREALLNASRFAGDAAPVSLYAELDQRRARVYVHDRGPGFALSAVPPDRHGVRESIIGRMERNGGQATIRSTPGAGTEVELTVELDGR